MDSYGRKLQLNALLSLPFFLLLIVMLVAGAVSIHPAQPLPPLVLSWGIIYYWILFQPARLSFFLLALAGLMQDIILGFPMGISSLCFMALRWLVMQLRRRISVQHFFAVWICFALMALLMAVLMTLCFTLAQRQFVPGLLVQSFYTAGIAWITYPLLHLLCNRIYTLIPSLQRA